MTGAGAACRQLPLAFVGGAVSFHKLGHICVPGTQEAPPIARHHPPWSPRDSPSPEV